MPKNPGWKAKKTKRQEKDENNTKSSSEAWYDTKNTGWYPTAENSGSSTDQQSNSDSSSDWNTEEQERNKARLPPKPTEPPPKIPTLKLPTWKWPMMETIDEEPPNDNWKLCQCGGEMYKEGCAVCGNPCIDDNTGLPMLLTWELPNNEIPTALEPEGYPTVNPTTQKYTYIRNHLRQKPLQRSHQKLRSLPPESADQGNHLNNGSSSSSSTDQPSPRTILEQFHLNEVMQISQDTGSDQDSSESSQLGTVGRKKERRKTREAKKKTEICNYLPNCIKGDACQFAHNEDELEANTDDTKDDKGPPRPHTYARTYNNNYDLAQQPPQPCTYVKPTKAQLIEWKRKEKRAIYNWAALAMQKMWSWHNGIEHKHTLRGPTVLSDGITPGRGQIYTKSWKPPCHWTDEAKHSLSKAWSPSRQTGQIRNKPEPPIQYQ